MKVKNHIMIVVAICFVCVIAMASVFGDWVGYLVGISAFVVSIAVCVGLWFNLVSERFGYDTEKTKAWFKQYLNSNLRDEIDK